MHLRGRELTMAAHDEGDAQHVEDMDGISIIRRRATRAERRREQTRERHDGRKSECLL